MCNNFHYELKSKCFLSKCWMTGLNVIELLVDDNVDFTLW